MAMIFDVREDPRFYCFGSGVSMRNGIDALYALIKTKSDLDVFNGDVFVFIGSNLKSIKVLQWNRNGFLLYYKRLEIGRFSLLSSNGENEFIELKSPKLRKIINRVRQRSVMTELKQRAITSI